MAKAIVRWALNVIAAAGIAVTLVVGVWPFFAEPNGLAQVMAIVLLTGTYLVLMYTVREARGQIEHVSLQRGTARFARYYADFYRLEGSIYIFCEDTEWLEGDAMGPVVDAIAGKGKKATVCLTDTSYPTTEVLRKREVEIVSVPPDQALEVKMSYRVNGTEKILIIRGAADGTSRRNRRHPVEVNTFTQTTNADFVNFADTIFSTIIGTRGSAPVVKSNVDDNMV